MHDQSIVKITHYNKNLRDQCVNLRYSYTTIGGVIAACVGIMFQSSTARNSIEDTAA